MATVQNGRLPPIVPLVLYHSEKKWEADTRFSSAVMLPNDSFLEFVPDFRFILYDLSRYSDDDIKGEILLKVAILIMKHIFDDELAPRLPGIFGLFRELLSKDTGLKYIETLLKYILSGTESVNEKDLASAMKQVAGEKGEEIAMTAAERLIQMGMEKGIQQGMQLGLIEGIVQTMEFTISAKFGDNDQSERACRIIRQINDPERLDEIKKAIKEAGSSKELLARLLS